MTVLNNGEHTLGLTPINRLLSEKKSTEQRQVDVQHRFPDVPLCKRERDYYTMAAWHNVSLCCGLAITITITGANIFN